MITAPKKKQANDPREFGENGKLSWTTKTGDKYVIVGTDVDGKKFRQVHTEWRWASQINLHRGRVYLLRDGKRWLVKSVWN